MIMNDFYTQKYPKARKKHKCEYCEKTIEIGEQYSYQSGKCGGEFYARELCLVCHNIASEYSPYINDDFLNWDSVSDLLDDNYCNGCKHGRHNEDDCKYKNYAQCQKIRKDFEPKEGD